MRARLRNHRSRIGGRRANGLPVGGLRIALGAAVCGLGLSCANTSIRGAGDGCVRASQCVAGLVCLGGVCTDDLSRLEAGVPRRFDAGIPLLDGSVPDGSVVDAGPVADAGSGRDAGPVDAGAAGPRDAGPPPPIDAGPPDAGPPPPADAGPPDAGPPPPPDAGSGSDAGTI